LSLGRKSVTCSLPFGLSGGSRCMWMLSTLNVLIE
jgi:hypothetical protein